MLYTSLKGLGNNLYKRDARCIRVTMMMSIWMTMTRWNLMEIGMHGKGSVGCQLFARNIGHRWEPESRKLMISRLMMFICVALVWFIKSMKMTFTSNRLVAESRRPEAASNLVTCKLAGVH